MPNQTITKTMTAPSTTAVGTISSAATPVVTLITSNFATQRRLSIWSTGALSSTWFPTINGLNETGTPVSETIVPSTVAGTVVLSSKDFFSVTSVTGYTTSPVTLVHIGLSSIGSTPWYLTNTLATPFNLGMNLVFSASNATTTASVDLTGQDIRPIFTSSGVFNPTIFGVSTAISTTGISTTGKVDFPVTAFRLTVNTTNAANTGVTLYTVPAGLGS